MDEIHENIIIGSGPAGYTAAIYAARALLKPLMIVGNTYGGQLMTTTDVDNFPGYPNGINGQDLMKDLHNQAERFGTNFLIDNVEKINKKRNKYEVITEAGKRFYTKTIIIATGASAKWLNAEHEDDFKNKGISTCATCDGFFYKNKKMIVIGGGDSAMEEALFLTKFAIDIIIINRSDKYKASKIMLEKAKNHDKISFLNNTVIKKWLGSDELTGAIIKNVIDGEVREIEFGAAFIAIGHIPATSFLNNLVDTDENGYIKVYTDKYSTATSLPGIFAAGDVCDPTYKQAITAAAKGCMAAIDCEKYLETI